MSRETDARPHRMKGDVNDAGFPVPTGDPARAPLFIVAGTVSGVEKAPAVSGKIPTGGLAMAALARPPRPKRVPVECGDLPFVIQRDGTWLYRGTPIGRKELVCLFAGVLKREADGSFWLETPAERGRIQVEDAPFVAVELDWTGDGRRQILSFRTNVDQVVTAGPEHPIRIAHDILTCEPTPYIRVRPGAGDFWVEARIGRAVYYLSLIHI